MEHCKHVQTTTITPDSDRYNLFDYSYTSSNSSASRSHWDKFAEEVAKFTHCLKGRVCEIGSNDGYLLKQFLKKDCDVLGVDASESMTKLSNLNKIKTINLIFDYNSSALIQKEHGEFDVVIANNVFNHSNDPVSFAKGANRILKSNGFYIFEVPYWKCSVESTKIDQIYHEHVSYFTGRSVKEIMELAGFQINRIEIVDYHGGSLRVYAEKTTKDEINHCDDLSKMISSEVDLFSITIYENLKKTLIKRKIDFKHRLLSIKKSGGSIIAIGAAAKGNTLLNFLNLDSSLIDWVTDTSKFKCGKTTPLSNIEICNDNVISTYEKVYALILCWNLSDAIKTKLRKLNPQIEFINFYGNNYEE